MYYWVDSWLCTHAGLSYSFYEEHADSGMNVIALLETMCHGKVDEKLYACSPVRGGEAKNAGILWCDYDEFTDIPDQKQIFGHTRWSKVRQKGNHICLDTELHHYAVYKNGVMMVKQVGKTI